ncbi:hypothetical protein K1T71_008121 [Dendrolimus kikuchii]|uniref:Uncharacterized protein n=1 Tax=Dendrolimus kikuchii TaxID=765133 RepID=A0ACC1CXE3_9NEOP|nr:hypothetical protein K1T71_008121 [Dendrolimus kikuchii]
MTRRKSVCTKWTLVLIVVVYCSFVNCRPQDSSSSPMITTLEATDTNLSKSSTNLEVAPPSETTVSTSARDVKTKVPIRESIKMVTNQLLDEPSNESVNVPVVTDSKTAVKQKHQTVNKHKIKTRNEDEVSLENTRPGIAVPITSDEIDKEGKISNVNNESSTTNEGISTWVLLSNPSGKENMTSTEATKVDDKKKSNTTKNKPKRPNTNKITAKRPIIASNKADLIAAGSAINENVYNKIKDTVLSNVQKNKSTTQKPMTASSSEIAVKESETTKRDTTKASLLDSPTPAVKVTNKPKKKNKNKHRTSTTESTTINESALLPMEPKEQEIELEISTPPTTTKKPKRSTTRKKTKTKKRKTSKPSADSETTIVQKTSNKTKSGKPTKKPAEAGAVVSQIYNYLSREVMPSVGVGMIGLASLVGIASYFFYPFSTPVRRTFEVDKKDDLYKYNGEEYASEGNGQAEEEMLGTVLAGMPAHAKNKLNPYAAQTPQYSNRYPVKKEQDLRYRQVTKYDPTYNRYPQQKTGIAHAAVYPKPAVYGSQYETRHAYTTEEIYNYEKASSQYTPYPAVEPIYAAPQTGPSASYGSATSNSVVYGVKPSAETDFKPVYPYEGQFLSESTSNPETYQPTSMYLGSNDDQTNESKFSEHLNSNETDESKFVVGNVPKELAESVTPAVVPEHGPRNLRRKRSLKRSISSSLEEILREKDKDNFISNEIDDAMEYPIRNLAPDMDPMPISDSKNEVIPVYAVSVDNDQTVIESVSTAPIDEKPQKTETNTNDLETTTKEFKVYEVFTNKQEATEQSQNPTGTTFKRIMTETTTELKSETTSTMPPSPSPILETKIPSTSDRPKTTTYTPEVITYPPSNQSGGFFSFLKRLVEFKYRLGLSILQQTSESLNRYLRSMESSIETSMRKVANASKA